jgi:hypothetical protein
MFNCSKSKISKPFLNYQDVIQMAIGPAYADNLNLNIYQLTDPMYHMDSKPTGPVKTTTNRSFSEVSHEI